MPDVESLLGLTPEDLAQDAGCDLTSARRLLGHVISDGGDDLNARNPVARALKDVVRARYAWTRPRVIERATSERDGFVKYLLEHEDGALAEAVRIPLDKEGRYSVCLSSQVGCAMGCVFCATGRLGLERNLTAAEIVGAFLQVRDDTAAEGGRVSGAVFMGQGEPFHNYDEVIQAAKVLSHPCGGRISQKAITISTVGLVPKIRRYTREGHKYRLIVSLTSAREEKRKKLLPVAGDRWNLDELKAALAAHAEATGDRVTLAWVLIGGENDTPDEADALAARFGDLPLIVNLIDINPTDDEHRRSTDAEREAFRDALRAVGAPVVRRYSGGRDKHAACGMLASKRTEV
jgi:23S rRNA (adenine2503-C2)-methyltransferase